MSWIGNLNAFPGQGVVRDLTVRVSTWGLTLETVSDRHKSVTRISLQGKVLFAEINGGVVAAVRSAIALLN